jgi:hypothetical protein
MGKFNRNRTRAHGLLARVAGLAVGPCLMLAACTVYDDALPNASSPLGGSGAASGASGAAGGSSQAGTDAGGVAAGGTPSSGGKAGDPVTAGGGGDSAGRGGSAGSSGAGSAGEPPLGAAAVIDDMEDGDAQMLFDAGRNGYWYTGSDESATATIEPPKDAFTMFELPEGDRTDSVYAAHLKATGCKGWGSVLGCNFIEQAGKVKAYDASDFCGVRFWGKAAAAVSVRFSVPDVDTHPEGGVCMVTGSAGQTCYDHFNASFGFTTTWREFTAKFAELKQTANGYHPPDGFKPAQIFSLEWALPGTTGNSYEIWVDDVQFVTCE